MAALMIINYDVFDRAALDAYRAVAAPILVGPSLGTAVAISGATVDLGEGHAAGSDTVVLRYESVEAAEAAYRSEAYQAVLPDRLNATTPKIALIVETLD
ncbi:MAG: hypothetical protein ETSY1_18845 [Candidatus Entotheonella factor]|uniref:DUF1330 domain-containing protein n=1 Tax=Entotheonella factor TaxID=1429438 RepID=W4LM46_ENTF1|nr:MAG: hypothetical protein ETSY1_18845 [Candidatus Entotheonella factor]